MTTLSPNPKIIIILEGLFISWIQDGASQARIGLLWDAPNHKRELVITEPGEPPRPIPFSEDIHFNVTNPVHRGIQEYHSPVSFDRPSHQGHIQDFRWLPKLEREIFNGIVPPPLDQYIRSGSLNPFIYIDNGVFYTHYWYPYDAVIVREGSPNPVPFGYLPESLGVAVELNPNSQAVLRIGSAPILTVNGSDPGQYIIKIDRGCEREEECPYDFDLIYRAIDIGEIPKIYIRDVRSPFPILEADKMVSGALRGGDPPSAPDVPCLLGNIP